MELYIVYNCSLERTVLHEYSYIYFVLIWIACAGFLMQRNKADSGISAWAAFVIGALMKREWAFKFHFDSFLIHQKHSFTLDFAWKWQSRGPHGYSSPWGESFYSLVPSSSVSHCVPSSQALVSATWPILLHHPAASSRAGLKCDTLIGAFLKQPRIPGTGDSSTQFWHHHPHPTARIREWVTMGICALTWELMSGFYVLEWR